jgi:hypothetical protein
MSWGWIIHVNPHHEVQYRYKKESEISLYDAMCLSLDYIIKLYKRKAEGGKWVQKVFCALLQDKQRLVKGCFI